MSSRQYPWDLREVPWSEFPEFTRGKLDGLVLLSWGIGPRDKLATRRQLRAQGLRPGGQDPVALLYFRCRRACKQVFAELFLVDKAMPVRQMTPAKWAAIDRALAARRTCRECDEDTGIELPKAHRTCEPCRYRLGRLDTDDYLHDYVDGTPTYPVAA
ncbi:hypothetical protein EV191_101927 [Tamaricihabitans halophyticus]|uniref:Uncharacterized protein n=1 Tax=Tamaricihabitans halophyticus TaxID=1262583 RepID=A0A4R2R4P8_9PSEU|nr:RRQRL motif-containing zinc-binding protein [Tamaricihabitans halophyticus]TCP56977.1 hypothetical protein EV191_101927 [Tamaricihabitans halophyticus]